MKAEVSLLSRLLRMRFVDARVKRDVDVLFNVGSEGFDALEQAQRERDRYRKALEHYAKEETYQGMTTTCGQWELLTREAREALAGEAPK